MADHKSKTRSFQPLRPKIKVLDISGVTHRPRPSGSVTPPPPNRPGRKLTTPIKDS